MNKSENMDNTLKLVESLRQELKEKDKRLERLGRIDYLTQIPNRAALDEYVTGHLSKKGRPLGLMALDFDNFKAFNNAYGYLLGDSILFQFSQNLQKLFPKDLGLVGRLNGEEFLAAVDGATETQMEELSGIFRKAAQELYIQLPDSTRVNANLTLSMGSTIWDGICDMSLHALLHQAGTALQRAKKEGKNCHRIFSNQDGYFAKQYQNGEINRELVTEMRGALERGEFQSFYQPLFHVGKNAIICAEALARWRHPTRGVLSPDKFIPLFEENGFIVNLDLYLFEENCKNIRKWLDMDLAVVPISCNFSRLHFMDPGFADRLKAIADKYNVATANFAIEITENMLVENTDSIIEQMRLLRSYGFSVSMDDFGSGYSSFGMLQEMPVDTIKLDRSFFCRDLSDFRNTTIICSIINVAKTLGIVVICEGIETKEQAHFLKSINCDIAQGYYYARPMECLDFEESLRKESVEREYPHPTDKGRSFIERIFRDFYVAQDIDKLLPHVYDQVQWFDMFSGGVITGVGQLANHFQQHVKGKALSLIYRGFTLHNPEAEVLLFSGEAMLMNVSQEPAQCINFYFAANCMRANHSLLLTKMHLDVIYENGYQRLMNSPRIPNMINNRLDETSVVDQYYSSLPVGIIRYDMAEDMLPTYINQELYRIIGYTKEQFYGELHGNLRVVVHPEDLSRIYKKSLAMMEGRQMGPCIYRFVRRDGKVVKVLYFQCNLPGIDGRPIVQGMYFDLDWLDET